MAQMNTLTSASGKPLLVWEPWPVARTDVTEVGVSISADAGIKGAEVRMVEVRLADGLGGMSSLSQEDKWVRIYSGELRCRRTLARQ